MMRYLLIALLATHGLIHLMGLVKGLGHSAVPGLTRPITRPMGLLWGLTALIFLITVLLVARNRGSWWMLAAPGIVLSTILVIGHWQDARYGMVANGLLIIAVITGAGAWSFRESYTKAVQGTLEAARSLPEQRITEVDLVSLPMPVQRHLRAAGVVGRARPRSMRIEFAGEIRGTDGPWMPFTTVQVNRFDVPARHFWMDATMKGLPTKGFHTYDDGHATMQVRILGLVPVMDVQGPELDTAETVTWFNDLCLFAPGALVDPRITWSPVDDRSAKASFTHKGITISALLVFDEEDRLVDFISDDRFLIDPPKPPEKRTFSTPASDHRSRNGLLLPGHGEAVWSLAGGPFTYGRFTLRTIAYDV